MSEGIRVERRGPVALLHLDDGKANAISPALVAAIDAALDGAEKDARAVVLAGRADRFSGGFHLDVMRQGGAATVELVNAGGRLALRLYEFPYPVVIACTGHALAMGAVLLLAADLRIGAEGLYKIGLNEVAIGLTLPPFAWELACERLSRRHLQRATTLAEIYDPAGAVDAGFLDRTVAPADVLETALAEASRLAALPGDAHLQTKRRMRAAVLGRIRASLERG
jgi:enoyl-CoA hydratase